MIDDLPERFRMLRKSRSLSTWGPDFNDEITVEAWMTKLDFIPFNVLQNTLAKLEGRKDFPSPAEIIETANQEIRAKSPKPAASQMLTHNPLLEQAEALRKEIYRTPEVKVLKEKAMQNGFFFKFDADLRLKTKLHTSKPDIELLNRYLENPQEMIDELLPKIHGWRY